MTFKQLAAALIALLLAACNPMAQLDGAEEQITRYHATYNSGDTRALYGLTSEEFRGATTLEQMEGLVALVSERMGPVQSTERASFNLNSDNGLTVSTIVMTTQFEKGEGTETYVFHGTGEDLRLVSWHVDSPNFEDVPVAEEAEAEAEPAE